MAAATRLPCREITSSKARLESPPIRLSLASIVNGEHDAREQPSEAPLCEQVAEDSGHFDRIVLEYTAAPGAEHQDFVPMVRGDTKHLLGPTDESGSNAAPLASLGCFTGIRSRRSQDGHEERRREELEPLAPKERHLG